MQKFFVFGMMCASCSARVEKAVLKVKGVKECNVSLITNTLLVEGSAKDASIISAVRKAGYDAEIQDGNKDFLFLDDKENLKKRLFTSIFFLLALLYITMGHGMLNLPLPSFLSENMSALGLIQFFLSSIVLIINKKFFTSGIKSLFHLSPNMNTLVALGSGVSFLYSTVILFSMIFFQSSSAEEKMGNLYFEGAAMIVTLITVGKLLEAVSKGRTTDAIKDLMKLAPENAVIIKDGKETEVSVKEIKIGDIFIVRPGESVPVDGEVIEGEASINEASLTGESIPSEKRNGSKVFSSTINVNGFLKCKAEHVGEDTTLSKIIRLVTEASSTKAPIARIADRVSGFFVPTVMAIAILTLTIWLILGEEKAFALKCAISVLLISCPCSLGLATPVAIMIGNGVGARNGILFKTSAALEIAGKIQTVAFDKTGTITKGKPEITDVIPASGIEEKDLLLLASSLEAKSAHPLADAVIRYFYSSGFSASDLFAADDFISLPGGKLSAFINGKKISAGSLNQQSSLIDVSSIKEKVEELSMEGKTPLVFSSDNRLLGLLAAVDTIKEDSAKAILLLKDMGIKTVMLTGDNEKTANVIAKKAGIEKVIAGILPDGKASEIKKLKEEAKTAMAGDGINDAPALTSADIGIAVGGGSDIAIDSASVVLMKDSLLDVPAAIKLGKATLKNIHENLFWAFFYNIIAIPLASGVFYTSFGLLLNPMFSAAAMSLSSFCVVLNALRLNLFNPYKSSHKKVKINKEKETFVMADKEKIFKVNGMMCSNCEKHVKEALEKISGIESAIPSHEKGEVVVKLSKEVSNEKIISAIKKAGYTVA